MDIILNTNFANPDLPVIQHPGFIDEFDRQAGSPLMGTDDGKAWEIFDFTSNPSMWETNGDGTASLKTLGNSYSAAVVNSRTPDGTLRAQLYTPGTSRWGGLVVRASDAKNWIQLSDASSTNASYALWSRLDGSISRIGLSSTAAAPGDTIEIKLLGTAVGVYVNGASIITAVDDNFTENTRHGIYDSSTPAASWDSVSFIPA